jgi:hypothetical protein
MVQRFLGMGVGARAGVGIKNGLISKREGGCCWNFPQLRLGDPKGLPFFYVQVWRSGWSRMDAQQDRPLALEMSLWHVGVVHLGGQISVLPDARGKAAVVSTRLQ